MAAYASTRRVESKMIPGVIIILKNLTEGRRIDLRKLLLEPQSRLNSIVRDIGKLEATAPPDRDQAKIAELSMKYDSIVMEEINPIWIKWGLKGLEGLDVDGKTMSVDDLMEFPSELFEEILLIIQGGSELKGDDAKNSLSLTTSGEKAGGKAKSSTVDGASEPDGLEAKTVGNTSLN